MILRVLIGIGLTLLGFVFPIAFLGAGLVFWALYAELTEPPSVLPEGYVDFEALTADDPDWQNQFRNQCESPAEVAFLDAMIDAFDLVPDAGTLTGGGLSMRLQVNVLRYRLDFLVDKRLAVEVDGAAWHSSDEAVARDRTRDAALHEHGYVTLRIPAKITLYDPAKSVEMVRDARSGARAHEADLREKKVKQVKAALSPKGLATKGGSILRSVSNGLDELSRKTTEMHNEMTAQTAVRSVTSYELAAAQEAVRHAQSMFQISLNKDMTKVERDRFLPDTYHALVARHRDNCPAIENADKVAKLHYLHENDQERMTDTIVKEIADCIKTLEGIHEAVYGAVHFDPSEVKQAVGNVVFPAMSGEDPRPYMEQFRLPLTAPSIPHTTENSMKG